MLQEKVLVEKFNKPKEIQEIKEEAKIEIV